MHERAAVKKGGNRDRKVVDSAAEAEQPVLWDNSMIPDLNGVPLLMLLEYLFKHLSYLTF